MEFLEGIDLDSLVTNFGPLPEARVIHLLRQACGALGEGHEAGVVHRDVKLANLYLCTRGGIPDVLKVLDFGLVKAEEAARVTRASVIVGTPENMAPELFESAENASPLTRHLCPRLRRLRARDRPPAVRGQLARRAVQRAPRQAGDAALPAAEPAGRPDAGAGHPRLPGQAARRAAPVDPRDRRAARAIAAGGRLDEGRRRRVLGRAARPHRRYRHARGERAADSAA